MEGGAKVPEDAVRLTGTEGRSDAGGTAGADFLAVGDKLPTGAELVLGSRLIGAEMGTGSEGSNGTCGGGRWGRKFKPSIADSPGLAFEALAFESLLV